MIDLDEKETPATQQQQQEEDQLEPEEKSGTQETKEVEDRADREEQITGEDVARKMGWNPNGSLPWYTFIERERDKRHKVENEYSRHRIETSRTIREMNKKLDEVLNKFNETQSFSQAAVLQSELAKARDEGDFDRFEEIHEKLVRIKSQSAPSDTRKKPDAREELEESFDPAIFDEFKRNNPWINESDEVHDVVLEEIYANARLGIKPERVLARAKRAVMEEYPELFSKNIDNTPPSRTRKEYSPPVGRGRPSDDTEDRGIKSFSDLPQKDREEMNQNVNNYLREKHIDPNDKNKVAGVRKMFLDAYKED